MGTLIVLFACVTVVKGALGKKAASGKWVGRGEPETLGGREGKKDSMSEGTTEQGEGAIRANI